jgi:hypothetical protein
VNHEIGTEQFDCQQHGVPAVSILLGYSPRTFVVFTEVKKQNKKKKALQLNNSQSFET